MMTEDVPYRYGDIVNDPAKRQELYSWLLAETIRQKVESRPELLTGTDYVDRSRKGYYRYDLSTGTMVYDETLGFIQQQADADGCAGCGGEGVLFLSEPEGVGLEFRLGGFQKRE